MRAIFFYPLAALAAAAAIAASFGPELLPNKAAPQAGRLERGALVYDATALAHMDVPDTQVAHVDRDDYWRAAVMQIATRRTRLDPSPALPGARLLLTPDQAAALAGKPIRVQVRVRPLPYTTAVSLAVSAQTGGPVAWTAQKLPAESAALSFHLPAIEGSPPQAIGFWPVTAARDYDYGVEIVEVRVGAD
jgi:hypothetical protein